MLKKHIQVCNDCCFACHIKNIDGGDSLGKALAKADINEKRLFMVIVLKNPTIDSMRRLLNRQPNADWQATAKTLYYWKIRQAPVTGRFFYTKTLNPSSA